MYFVESTTLTLLVHGKYKTWIVGTSSINLNIEVQIEDYWYYIFINFIDYGHAIPPPHNPRGTDPLEV